MQTGHDANWVGEGCQPVIFSFEAWENRVLTFPDHYSSRLNCSLLGNSIVLSLAAHIAYELIAREYMSEVDKFCDESEEEKPMDIVESQGEKIILGNFIREYFNNTRSFRINESNGPGWELY